jgi:hypothetical protein
MANGSFGRGSGDHFLRHRIVSDRFGSRGRGEVAVGVFGDDVLAAERVVVVPSAI